MSERERPWATFGFTAVSMIALAVAACGRSGLGNDTPSNEAAFYDGGRVFMCRDCRCDGRVAFCSKATAGPPRSNEWDDAPDGDACPQAISNQEIGCIPYDTQCSNHPSCGCIDAGACGACLKRDGGEGFEVRGAYP